MFENLFKRRKPTPPYDYESALALLAAACQKQKAFTVVFPSVYYDLTKGMFAVRFECAQKEYIEKKDKFFLAIRRNENYKGTNLEQLLEFAIAYADTSDAFVNSPKDNLPEGITVNIKNFIRTPRNYSLSRKL